MTAASTIFILFVLTASPLPALSPVAAFADQGSCQKAADTMTAAIAGAQGAAKIACVSETSLEALGNANKLSQ